MASVPTSGKQSFEHFLRASVDKVSRETWDTFDQYAALLVAWQARINLIGPKTVNNLWQRHFLDSAQLLPLLPEKEPSPAEPLRVLDIGSGAGFPGLVLAILLQDRPIEVHLVESDQRKCAFLRAVVASFSGNVAVHAVRLEAMVDVGPVHVVTARALAPLATLLGYVDQVRDRSGQIFAPRCLFLKGQNAEAEIAEARRHWAFEARCVSSLTSEDGAVVVIEDFNEAERNIGQ